MILIFAYYKIFVIPPFIYLVTHFTQKGENQKAIKPYIRL